VEPRGSVSALCRALDPDRNGTFGKAEISEGLGPLGCSLSPGEASTLFCSLTGWLALTGLPANPHAPVADGSAAAAAAAAAGSAEAEADGASVVEVALLDVAFEDSGGGTLVDRALFERDGGAAGGASDGGERGAVRGGTGAGEAGEAGQEGEAGGRPGWGSEAERSEALRWARALALAHYPHLAGARKAGPGWASASAAGAVGGAAAALAAAQARLHAGRSAAKLLARMEELRPSAARAAGDGPMPAQADQAAPAAAAALPTLAQLEAFVGLSDADALAAAVADELGPQPFRAAARGDARAQLLLHEAVAAAADGRRVVRLLLQDARGGGCLCVTAGFRATLRTVLPQVQLLLGLRRGPATAPTTADAAEAGAEAEERARARPTVLFRLNGEALGLDEKIKSLHLMNGDGLIAVKSTHLSRAWYSRAPAASGAPREGGSHSGSARDVDRSIGGLESGGRSGETPRTRSSSRVRVRVRVRARRRGRARLLQLRERQRRRPAHLVRRSLLPQ
jgi:hypothetical protein